MTTPSPIFIEATETDPTVLARAAIERTQQTLLGTIRTLSPAELAQFAAQDVRGYLDAADQTLYAAGAGAAESRLVVRALRSSAKLIGRRIDALAAVAADAGADAAAVAAAAAVVEAQFAAHVAVEQEVLLPFLAALPGAELPTLAEDLETVCSGGSLAAPDVVDVREIRHGQRHPRIFARFARLAPGEGFTLVNNHDPKPLRREFEATYPGAFSWRYLESGPEQWQVRIGREPEGAENAA